MGIHFSLWVGRDYYPTVDPLNQTLVGGPLIIIYEMSIWLAKLFQPKYASKAVSVPLDIWHPLVFPRLKPNSIVSMHTLNRDRIPLAFPARQLNLPLRA
jgi:hypothetical protein